MGKGWILLISFVWVQLIRGFVENVAVLKTATMSTAIQHYGPEKAVDGNTNAVYPGGIIDTGPGHQFSWWRVDLGTQVQDATVEMYFRTDYKRRRSGVQLYTSANQFTDTYRGQLCYEVTGRPDGLDILDVVSVNCSGSWRYLMVYTQTNNDGQGATLDFGEVKVLVCSSGSYGASCNKSCSNRHCVMATVLCDRYSGSCPGGCVSGYTGSDCTRVFPPCTSGAYGLNCTKSCNSRQCAVTPTSCDRLTGACLSGGCKAGWMGTDCTQDCTDGSYGWNCTKSCASRKCIDTSTSCDTVYGQCLGGCKPGWRETDCLQVCVDGMYGSGCNLSCIDRKCTTSTFSCNHVTGQCNGGCQPGWIGTDCTQKCPKGKYGLNCRMACRSRSCEISSDTCDHVTGNCSGLCRAGFMGTDCIKACTSGTYGANCVYNCSARHCRSPSSPCDRETGQCPNGCVNGWTGRDCAKSCPKGTFGLNCSNCSIRHCQGPSDCSGDGSCAGGCKDGWTLNNCTQACSNGTYGPRCNSTCGHCNGDGECDHVSGNCRRGCTAGWQSLTCKQACPSGKYGVNCVNICSHCNGTCEAADGRCTLGCRQGYYGIHCNNKLSDVISTSTGPYIGAVIGLVVVFVICGGLFLCFMRNGRLQWMAGKRPEDLKQSTEMSDVSSVPVISQGVSDPPQSSSTRPYNNDYAVLDIQTKSDNKVYDVIKNRDYENI